MAHFIVRVELRDIPANSRELYERLHAAMEVVNFRRTLTVGGQAFHLPDAMYTTESTVSVHAVYELARKAVERVHKTFVILVVEAASSGKGPSVSGYLDNV